jgi:hypothetical protein
MKKLAIKHKDIINPVVSSLKSGASKGVAKLAKAAQDKIDSNINTVEGGAVKRRRGRPKKGEGFGALLGPLIKLAAPVIIDAVAGAAKKKVGTGAKKKAGRPKK